MARGPKCRRVEFSPRVTSFKPGGIPHSCLEEILVKIEELEAIRLKDLLGIEQEECAEKMGVSRPTFQRILIEGRRKIAQALIEGQAIRIEGGNYCLGQEQCRRHLNRQGYGCLYWQDYAGENIAQKSGTKIAVCAGDNSPTSKVDGRFGRCAYFMLWDEEKEIFEAINNQAEPNQGAGTGAAHELLRRGAGTLICNRIGPRAFKVFQSAGVRIYSAQEGMDVDTALKQYRLGKLPTIETANNK